MSREGDTQVNHVIALFVCFSSFCSSWLYCVPLSLYFTQSQTISLKTSARCWGWEEEAREEGSHHMWGSALVCLRQHRIVYLWGVALTHEIWIYCKQNLIKLLCLLLITKLVYGCPFTYARLHASTYASFTASSVALKCKVNDFLVSPMLPADGGPGWGCSQGYAPWFQGFCQVN